MGGGNRICTSRLHFLIFSVWKRWIFLRRPQDNIPSAYSTLNRFLYLNSIRSHVPSGSGNVEDAVSDVVPLTGPPLYGGLCPDWIKRAGIPEPFFSLLLYEQEEKERRRLLTRHSITSTTVVILLLTVNIYSGDWVEYRCHSSSCMWLCFQTNQELCCYTTTGPKRSCRCVELTQKHNATICF